MGTRIRRLRKALKLTQAQVGKAVGVSASAVVQWEAGDTHPTGKNLLSLADTLRTTPGELVTGRPSRLDLTSLRPDQIALIDGYESSNPEIRAAARRLFEIPEGVYTPDSGKKADIK